MNVSKASVKRLRGGQSRIAQERGNLLKTSKRNLALWDNKTRNFSYYSMRFTINTQDFISLIGQVDSVLSDTVFLK